MILIDNFYVHFMYMVVLTSNLKYNQISILWMLLIKTKFSLILMDEMLSVIIIPGLKVYSLQLNSILYDCKVAHN